MKLNDLKELKYRVAQKEDAITIALLHADSWKRHYRGICTDDYLDHHVVDDRKAVWLGRFENPNPRQGVIVAIHRDQMIGFVCTFLDYHNEHGAYLDNLHVVKEYQGNGIGKELMKRTTTWVRENRPSSKIYLHVLEKNESAIAFYSKIGGLKLGPFIEEMPWKGKDTLFDFLWDLEQLIGH